MKLVQKYNSVKIEDEESDFVLPVVERRAA